MTLRKRQPDVPAAVLHRVGAVSFLNTRPLICGLDDVPGVYLERAVPAELAGWLTAGRVDAALAPSVDYQLVGGDWLIAPGAVIASAGEVLTVRVFSRRPLDQIERIACDRDSHTSVLLAQVVWRLRFGRAVAVEPLTGDPARCEAVLLVGDKVIAQLDHWPYQLDLGQAWLDATALPFVYAFWSLRRRDHDRDAALAGILLDARRRGQAQLDELADRYGPEHGFAPALARDYFHNNLIIAPDESCWRGLERFYRLAHEMALLPEPRPLRFVDGG